MKNRRDYLRERRSKWKQFQVFLERLEDSGRKKLRSDHITQFSRALRELSHDLSLVRSREWGGQIEDYLNNLVTRGYNQFYRHRRGGSDRIARFLGSGFPRVFRKNINYFWAATALFLLPLLISWALVQTNEELALRILPKSELQTMEQMYSEDLYESGDGGFSDARSAMAGFYVRNNVGIALRCFALGILFGVGTIYILLSNGIVLGAVTGYVIASGHGERFLSFVVSHGSFELTAIAVAGGGGLMLGDALVHPGSYSRVDALKVRGAEAVQIAFGAAVMLVIAALIEAFWSPAPIPPQVKYTVGGLLWLLVIGYLALAGRGGGDLEFLEEPVEVSEEAA